MRCKHCGIGLQYYSNIEHSCRKSCMLAENGYHYFVTDIYYFVYTVYFSCWGKTKHATSYPMQAPLRQRVQDSEADRHEECAK